MMLRHPGGLVRPFLKLDGADALQDFPDTAASPPGADLAAG
jgi:hypothetical protein